MTAELCRDIALEAGRRSSRVHPHELWAVLAAVDATSPQVIVDVWSEPAVWWAWWSTGAHVVAVAEREPQDGDGFSGSRWPSSVSVIVGDPRLPDVRQAVEREVDDRRVDVLVLGGRDSEDGVRSNFDRYSPMVRAGGLVAVHGIANRRYPGIRRFWSDLRSLGGKDYVGSQNPDGYGLVQMNGKEAANHG